MNAQTPIVPSIRLCWDPPKIPQSWPVGPGGEAQVAPGLPTSQTGRRRMAAAASTHLLVLSKRARTVLARRLLYTQRKRESAKTLAAVSLTEVGAVRLAANCSRSAMLALHGSGPAVVAEVETWLAAQGKRFRAEPSSSRTALARAIGHIEAMLEARDDSTFMAAYVALPELRRSLAPRCIL